jgi:hypothetical protein
VRALRGLVITAVAAFVAFCLVQDLVTAAGARRYVWIQQEAMAGHTHPVTVDEVMTPAIRASVRDGLLSAGAVVVIGSALVYVRRRR